MSDSMPLASWDLMDPKVQQCPYAFYAAARRDAPLYRMPQTGFYLVTSFELCRAVMKQPDLFVSGVSPMALKPEGVPAEVIDVFSRQGWMPEPSCSTSDPPRHTRVRAFLEPLFTAKRVREIAPLIARTTQGLIDALPSQGEFDFVAEFAHPLPMIVIAELIGVPDADLARFKIWSDAIVEPFSMMVSREREIECAQLVVEMQHYFADLLKRRRTEPRDDLITKLASAADDPRLRFTLEEQLTILTIDLLASGNETTTAALASGMRLLIEDPAALAEARGSPGRIANLAEEVLRLESPAQGMFRRVTRDTTLAGIELREGDLLSLRFGSANRDEAQFPAAQRIDLDRRVPGKHLAFGIGRHHCIGAQLARQELVTAFGVLLERYESFARAPGAAPLEYTPSFFGRNLRRLDVSVEPRRRA